MDAKSGLSSIFTEKLFYRAVVGLLVGLPVLELFTEIAYRFNNEIHPLYFVPLVLDIYGFLATLLIVLYWFTAVPGKRKLRYSDIFYFTLLFFMVIAIIFSQNFLIPLQIVTPCLICLFLILFLLSLFLSFI